MIMQQFINQARYLLTFEFRQTSADGFLKFAELFHFINTIYTDYSLLIYNLFHIDVPGNIIKQ